MRNRTDMRDKTESNKHKPRDLRDRLVPITLEYRRSVFDPLEEDGQVGVVAPDSRISPGQTTRE
jgi:hypothetical protein